MASMMLYTQVRTRVANFFVRRTANELIKGATGISKFAMKKGQGIKHQRPIRGLSKLYHIGASPMRVQYPGLNKPLFDKSGQILSNVRDPIALTNAPFEKLKADVFAINKYFDGSSGGGKLKGKASKLGFQLHMHKQHALDRGFCSYKIEGMLLGRPPFQGEAMKDFQCAVLTTSRICVMTKIGRRYKSKALVFIGNGNGIGSYAVGYSSMSKTWLAIMKALRLACRRLFFIERLNDHTVYHDFYAECNYTRIFVQRQYQGHGITAHPRLEVICRLLGIKDIYCKVEGGRRNYLALCHAFVTGLINQETHRELAERTGMHVVKLDPARNYYPEITSSPINSPMKKEEDLTLQERLRLDDFYGEGRYPLKKLERFARIRYNTTPMVSMYHTPVQYKKHIFRNMEERIIRLLADGELPRWTRAARKLYGQKQHEEAMLGQRIIPRGIGLGDPEIPRKKETESS